jgi:hypothetical protein
MSAEIKIEEVSKVIARKMTIGDKCFWQEYYDSRVGEERREVYVNPSLVKMRDRWLPIIEKYQLGWGCQVVRPTIFKKILQGIKTKGFKYSYKNNIKVQSLQRVVKIGVIHKGINKAELIEKMELLLKIHNFLYKKNVNQRTNTKKI